MKTRVINLFGGPGCGKSTLAAGLFHKMKSDGFSVELVDEYAKQLTWELRQKEMVNQLYIFAKQYKKLERLKGKVEYIITDSPLLLSLAYLPKNYFPSLSPLVEEVNLEFDNRNFLLERSFPFIQSGRNQKEFYAKKIDTKIREVLKGRSFVTCDPSSERTINEIIFKGTI